MAIKINMSKTYDMIEWTFLEEVLIRLAFEWTWINGQPKGV